MFLVFLVAEEGLSTYPQRSRNTYEQQYDTKPAYDQQSQLNYSQNPDQGQNKKCYHDQI